MTRRMVLLAIAALTISVRAVDAHEGHAHTVMGSVTAVDTKHLELKTPSGEVLSIAITAKTTVVREKKKASLRDIQVGRRAVVDIGNGEDPLIAREIKIGAVAAAAPGPTAPVH